MPRAPGKAGIGAREAVRPFDAGQVTMEYVQTVLARIQATRFEEATQPGSLFSQIEGHRGYLSSQPGFDSMQVTRSANPEGDVLVVVETRWSNNNALADYS